MPVVFISPEKRKRQLIAMLVGFLGFLIVLIIWRVFFVSPPAPVNYKEIYKFPEIKIDFEFLDSEKIGMLQLPTEVEKPERKGRANPFLPPQFEEYIYYSEYYQSATTTPLH